MKSIFISVLFLALSNVSFADNNMDGKGQPTETQEDTTLLKETQELDGQGQPIKTRKDTTLLKEMPKPAESEAATAPKKHRKKKTHHYKTKTPPPAH